MWHQFLCWNAALRMAAACWSQICFCVLINPLSLTHPPYHNATGGGGEMTPLRDTVCLTHVLLCQSCFTLRYPACYTPAVGIGELPRRQSTTDPIEIPHIAWVEKTIYSHHHHGWAAAIRASNQVIRRFYLFKSTGSWGSMWAEEGEPSIYLCICMHTFVCVHTSTFIMAFHRHSNTPEGVRITWERQGFTRQQHYRRWLNSKSWGGKLSRTDWLWRWCLTSAERLHATLSAQRGPLFDQAERQWVKCLTLKSCGGKNQTALIHFCWIIAQKCGWIDVNLSDYNKNLDNRPRQILGRTFNIHSQSFLMWRGNKLHWYAVDANATKGKIWKMTK